MIWTTRRRSDFGGIPAIRIGSGPCVVLLHGVGLRAEAWNAQIDALADAYEVIAPDMPGHGEHMTNSSPDRLMGFAEPIADAISGEAALVGHSMGAMIALEIAAKHPGKVKGVAALNAIYRRNPAAKQSVRERTAAISDSEIADPSRTLLRWFGGLESTEKDACRQWMTSVDPKGYKAAYTVFAEEDGPDDKSLSSLAMPALFITGAEEPNSTPEMSRKMADLAPNGKAIIVKGAAHMMPMTHATEVNSELRSFLAECAR